MKKIIIAVSPFILFSCVDSELYVPDENIGEVDVEIEVPVDSINTDNDSIPETSNILSSYVSNFPNAIYTMYMSNDGKLSNAGKGDITRDENSNIVTVIRDNKTFSFDYTDGKLTSITNNSGENLNLTYNGNTITATKSYVDFPDTIDYNYEYTLNSSGLIQKFFATSTTDSTDIAEININYYNENVSSFSFENGTISIKEEYNYDSLINPIKSFGEEDYTVLLILDTFIYTTNESPDIQRLSLLYNQNNRVLISDQLSNYSLEYLYEDNKPLSADITISNQNVGLIEYIY